MKGDKKLLIKFGILFALFIIFTIIIKVIDVKAIGPDNSEVGLASINDAFHNMFGYNDTLYKISKILGYVSFGIILLYAVLGLIQWIERKKISKVDKEILVLGSFYALVLLVYVIFEKVIINYRPVLEDGVLEASYPSSHTILSICVCVTGIMMAKRLFKNANFKKLFNIGSALLMVGIIATRLFSGVHWLTDIIGGLLISSALCVLFAWYLSLIPKKGA